MADVHIFSLKIGTAAGLWQYKVSGTHEKVVMHGLRRILNGTCERLGFDTADRSVVYLFSFSSEPFPGWQICLERIREAPGGNGCSYRVRQSTIGDFSAAGVFPDFVNTDYLRRWPQRIYCRLEKSLTGGLVS